MKIALISFGHTDPSSALAKYLVQRGNIVTLIYVVYNDRFINSIVDFNLHTVPLGISSIDILRDTSIDTNYFINYLGDKVKCWLLKLPSRSLKDFRNISYIKKLSKKIKDFNPDVIHFNGSSAFQILLYVVFWKYVKVYTIHDLIQHSGSESIRNDFYNWLHTKCNYIFIQHSESLRKIMLEKYKLPDNKVFATYYGPFEFYNYYKDEISIEEFPSAIFFGRITKYKGLKYFCQAIEIVTKKIPESRFYILGKGNFDFDMEYYIKNYPIDLINTHIDNQTLADYLSKSSLVVLPYTDATQSGVVLTAYAFNKPVIASRVGGIPEIVIEEETGYLVEPKNPEQLAEKIIYLFTNRDKLNFMKERISNLKADKTNRFMSWEKIAEETESIYNSAIKLKNKK